MKGIDLSKFRKVDANRDHTIMEDSSGHKIFINHKSITKEMHDALRNLPVQKLAKGGVVKSSAPGTKEAQDAISKSFNNALGFKKMATGGIVGIQGEEFPPADPEEQNFIPQVTPAEQVPADAGVAGMLAHPTPASSVKTTPTLEGPQNFQIPTAMGASAAQTPQAPSQPGVEAQALGQYQQGVNQEATANSAIAKDQMKVLQDEQVQQQQYATRLDENLNKRQEAYTAFSNYLADPKNNVNPQRYMQNQDTWGRISTAIGLGLGGAPAREFLEKQIDNDIKAQQAAVDNKKTLYAENLKLLGDEQSALAQTQVMMHQMVENQIKVAALKQATPVAQANALKLGAEFAAKNGELIAKEAEKATKLQMLGALPATSNGPNKYRDQVTRMEAIDPKRASDMRERLTPVGFADTAEDAKEVKTLVADSNTARQNIKRLDEISRTTGKSFSLKDRQEADSLVTLLVASLNKPVTGGGPLQQSERELLSNLAKNPTSIFSLDSTNQKAYDTLLQFVNRREANSLKARGLEAPAQPGPKPQGSK